MNENNDVNTQNISDLSNLTGQNVNLSNVINSNKRAGLTARKYQNQVSWRRNKVRELITRGYTQYEISQELHISQSTVSRDISYLEKELAKSRKNYGYRLFSTYESTLLGYDEIIKKLWSIVDSKNTDDKERIKAITLAGQYYQKRMELIKSEPELVANKKNMEHLQIFES